MHTSLYLNDLIKNIRQIFYDMGEPHTHTRFWWLLKKKKKLNHVVVVYHKIAFSFRINLNSLVAIPQKLNWEREIEFFFFLVIQQITSRECEISISRHRILITLGSNATTHTKKNCSLLYDTFLWESYHDSKLFITKTKKQNHLMFPAHMVSSVQTFFFLILLLLHHWYFVMCQLHFVVWVLDSPDGMKLNVEKMDCDTIFNSLGWSRFIDAGLIVYREGTFPMNWAGWRKPPQYEFLISISFETSQQKKYLGTLNEPKLCKKISSPPPAKYVLNVLAYKFKTITTSSFLLF